MTKEEKFNAFIDERVVLAKSKATTAAYLTVKKQFNTIFQVDNNDLYNAILDIDIDSRTQTGTFVGEKRQKEVFEFVEMVTDGANKVHNEGCDKKKCPGVLEFLIPQLKIHLTAHPEHDISTVLAIVAGVFLEMGKQEQRMKQKIGEAKESIGDIGSLLKRIMKDGAFKERGISIIDISDKDKD